MIIDIQYRVDAFKGKVDHVVGSGIIVIFDDNYPQRDDGVYEDVTGDLLISKRYFLWVNERFLNGYSRDLWTYSKRLYSTYKTKNTYRILFAPESNSDLITYSIGPKVKVVGVSQDIFIQMVRLSMMEMRFHILIN